MDIEKITTFTTEHLADYFDVFATTLVRPRIAFQCEIAIREPGDFRQVRRERLNPRLLVYVVISLATGIIINNVLLRGIERPDLISELVIIGATWLLVGCAVHVWCKMLGGRGRFVETTTVVLQLLATVFVLSSVISIISFPVFLRLSQFGPPRTVFMYPDAGNYHLFLTAILLTLYLPMGLRDVHGFGWFRAVLVAMPIVLLGWLVATFMYLSFGFLDGASTP